jgi:hypothetical protein
MTTNPDNLRGKCEIAPPTTLRHHMTVEGRPLCPRDLEFLHRPFSLSGYYSFVCPELTRKMHTMNTDDIAKDWKAAFHQMVKMTPILQCQIVGEGPSAVFAKLPEDEWPTIQVHYINNNNVYYDDYDPKNGVEATAKALGQMDQELIGKGGPEAVRAIALRAHVVLGQHRIALQLAAPHCYMDGYGMHAVGIKIAAYCRLSKKAWPDFDLLSSHEVPSYFEMLLKKDIAVLPHTEDIYAMNKSRPGLDPNNFSFVHYDKTALGAEKLLNGYQGSLTSFRSSRIEACRAELRKRGGVSVSTAFGGLVLKIMAIILQRHNVNQENKPLIIRIPASGRAYGKWPNDDDTKMQLLLPVVADYVYSYEMQVDFREALEGSINHLARLLKASMRKAESSLESRVRNISKLGSINTSRMALGVTSIPSPVPEIRERMGFHDEHHTGAQGFGSEPRVWIYVVTLNKDVTTIDVDIKLPIQGLTEAEVKSSIKNAASGSSLEMLFNVSASNGNASRECTTTTLSRL